LTRERNVRKGSGRKEGRGVEWRARVLGGGGRVSEVVRIGKEVNGWTWGTYLS